MPHELTARSHFWRHLYNSWNTEAKLAPTSSSLHYGLGLVLMVPEGTLHANKGETQTLNQLQIRLSTMMTFLQDVLVQ